MSSAPAPTPAPAPAPTQAPAGGAGLPRPQPPQATTGQGATSVMIRPLFALEDVVLYVFVAVQSFFFWIFSSVYSRAMDVHGLFNLPRPQSASPRIAADSSSSPSAPADVAPALPRISGRRKAWNARGRIVEGILSGCVYVYFVYGVLAGRPLVSVPSSLATMLLTFTLTSYVGIAAVEAFSELYYQLRYTHRGFDVSFYAFWRRSSEERTDLDGVDLAEYAYFLKLSHTRADMLGFFGVPTILMYPCASTYDFFASFAHQVALSCLVSLSFCCFGGFVLLSDHPFTRKAPFGKMYKWWQLCIKQPRCRHVRVFLLATGAIYTVLLHVSDVPSGWTSSLITIHSTRLLSLLVALRGDNETVAEAAEEVVEHVQEVG